MRKNRLFFSQTVLDEWLAEDRVDIENQELFLKAERRRYSLCEAVRILREVAGGDPLDWVGRVKDRTQLAEHSAELMESSLIVGESAYDVDPGFVGELMNEAPTDSSEEQMLAQFLLKSL
jgi:hypothetical protein